MFRPGAAVVERRNWYSGSRRVLWLLNDTCKHGRWLLLKGNETDAVSSVANEVDVASVADVTNVADVANSGIRQAAAGDANSAVADAQALNSLKR